jgi:hypothetical protein
MYKLAAIFMSLVEMAGGSAKNSSRLSKQLPAFTPINDYPGLRGSFTNSTKELWQTQTND